MSVPKIIQVVAIVLAVVCFVVYGFFKSRQKKEE